MLLTTKDESLGSITAWMVDTDSLLCHVSHKIDYITTRAGSATPPRNVPSGAAEGQRWSPHDRRTDHDGRARPPLLRPAEPGDPAGDPAPDPGRAGPSRYPAGGVVHWRRPAPRGARAAGAR